MALKYEPGAWEAGSKQLSDISNTFLQNKLEMAMMSKKMELEANARERQISLTGEETRKTAEEARTGSMERGEDIGKLMGAVKSGGKGLEGMLYPAGTANAALSAVGMNARAEAYMDKPYTSLPAADGAVQRGFRNMATGNWTSQPQTVLDPNRVKKITAADDAYLEISANLAQVNALAKNVLAKDPSLISVPLQELRGKLVSKGLMSGSDADTFLKGFIDFAPAVGLRIGKIQDGQVRGQFMGQIDTASLSNITDTLKSGLFKNDQVLQSFQHKVGAVHTSYDPSDYQKSEYNPNNINYAWGNGKKPKDHFNDGADTSKQGVSDNVNNQFFKDTEARIQAKMNKGKSTSK